MEQNIGQQTRVGVGIMILKGGEVLLCQRKGAHGAGEYGFPGGHLEYMETFEECILREVKEECGVEIENIQFQFLANLHKYTPKHYVHAGFVATWKSGESQVLEPDKCVSWRWYKLDELPQPLFATCQTAFESYQTGRNYFNLV